ncbi:hypothetical protein [Thioclava sp.]|uniref:hypothetical protein n=1 Tax=Thioclava sp. TaxID=1933450 RepID=UPI003AA9E028
MHQFLEMEHLDKSRFTDAGPAATTLSAPEYIKLIHPPGSVGKITLMTKDACGGVHSVTHTTATAPILVNCLLDGDGYVSLHRFHGPRRVDRLAALNGLFLDLDIDRLPRGSAQHAKPWAQKVTRALEKLRLPMPSILLSTGRGLAAIWLISPLPPQALPRWQSAQNVLIELFRQLGADPSCRDAARVTRLPGSLNTKCGREAHIMQGSLSRYDFDQFSDAIYTAAGRPTREQLRDRKARQSGRKQSERTGGLAPAERFAAVLRDLERLRGAWGGLIPEGYRNTWLHLYATCLSHTANASDVAGLVEQMASQATPGLPPSEVRPIAKMATSHASLPRASSPGHDGRYHYSGATIAERLGVLSETARGLQLEQIMPLDERARRKAGRECERRKAAGAVSRAEWLSEHSKESVQPWLELGISRSTYFRRLKNANPLDTIASRSGN